MPSEPIDFWKRGDPFSAGHLNQTVKVARQIQGMLGGRRTNILPTPDGTAIGLSGGDFPFSFRLGVITDMGPNGAADYADSRYYVKSIYFKGENPTDEPDVGISAGVQDEDGDFVEQFPLTAVHLSEALNGGHNLSTDETQIVAIVDLPLNGGLSIHSIIPIDPPTVRYLKLSSSWSPTADGNGNLITGYICKFDGSDPATNVLNIRLTWPTSGGSAKVQFSPLITNDVVAFIPTGSNGAGTNITVGIALPTRQIPLCVSNRTYLTGNFSGTVCTLGFDYVRGVSL